MGLLNKTIAVINEILIGTRRTVAAQEAATLGSELATAEGWTLGTGWSGSLASGFTHTPGNTEPLTFAMTSTGTKKYLIQLSTPVALSANFVELTVKIGNTDTFDLYNGTNTYNVAIASIADGNLIITPHTDFNQVLTVVSIKEITAASTPVKKYIDSASAVSREERSTLASLKNIFIGVSTGQNNVTGYQNVGVGDASLASIISGFWNVAIGSVTLNKLINGSRNIAIGHNSLKDNIVGRRNIAIGTFSNQALKAGEKNIGIGADSLYLNETGNSNIAIGCAGQYNSVDTQYNIGIGDYALFDNLADYNIAIGAYALENNTTGQNNIVIGYNSATTLTTGSNVVVIGNNVAVPAANTSNYVNIANLIIAHDGTLKVTVPTYSDNAAAVAGGLTAGDFYKTAAGDLRIVV